MYYIGYASAFQHRELEQQQLFLKTSVALKHLSEARLFF
jgi:hypothetical protein